MRRVCLLAASMAVCVWSASAQPDSSKITVRMEEMKSQLEKLLVNPRIVGIEGGVMGAAVKGAPYSADEVRENTQVLGDGTRIHNQGKVTVYRDSDGRLRRETPDEINIWDPIAGVTYIIDPKTMTYRKMEFHILVRTGDGNGTVSTYTFSGGPQSGAVSGGATNFEKRVFIGGGTAAGSGDVGYVLHRMTPTPQKKEPLGTRMIEGVNCEGERSTTTIEAGAIGNDRPISSVSERWYSPDLQLTVATSKSDPRSGEETFKLTNVRRTEPDAGLFQLPAGYQPAGPAKL